MKKYTSGSCPNYYEPTLGVDCGEKHIQSKGTLVHITFWDFSGKMDFLELRNQFYKQAQVIILFVDLTNKTSAEGVDYWLKEVQDNGVVCPVYIAGNKADSKKITTDFSKIAREKEGIYLQISSKNGDGVQQLMEKILSDFK